MRLIRNISIDDAASDELFRSLASHARSVPIPGRFPFCDFLAGENHAHFCALLRPRFFVCIPFH